MPEETWYYVQHGASAGPTTRAAMEQMARAGQIGPDTLVWPGAGDWIPAASSSLSAAFQPAGPVGPGGMPPMILAGATKTKSFLPENKVLRVIIGIIVIAIGLYAMRDGLKDMGIGLGGGGSDATIQVQGCQGVSTNAVQCGYTNVGQTKGRVCMDVVVICSDGRHVASGCSDPMAMGESTSKTFDNFKPAVLQTSTCSGMVYENVRTKG